MEQPIVHPDGALPDEALILRVKAHDTAAFSLLVTRYELSIKVLVRGYRAAGLEREDLTQEALVGLMKAVRSFDVARGVPFGSYAVLCMRRQVLTAVRSAGAGKHKPLSDYVPLDDAGDFALYAPVDRRTASPEAILIKDEEATDRSQQVQSLLSAFEQETLSLYLAGHSHAEMAKRLHSTPKSVDNALQRVRRKLRDMKL